MTVAAFEDASDGRRAIVVAEAHRELDFRDPHTMQLTHRLRLPGCDGVDHMDYTADGRLALTSCEFGARLQVVDLVRERALKVVALKSAKSSAGGPLHKPTPQQYACVSYVTGGNAPALVDKAQFQGHPATIIALSHVGNQVGQAWVVGPSCSASAEDILKHVTLPTSGG